MAVTLKVCPNKACKAFGNLVTTNFCTDCGTELVKGQACRKCYKIVSKLDNFCGECGRPTK